MVGQGFSDEQVGTFSAQAILTVNVTATVHNPLQKSLQQQLRSSLSVIKLANPGIRILTEELLEVKQQFLHVDAVVGIFVPQRILDKSSLRTPC